MSEGSQNHSFYRDYYRSESAKSFDEDKLRRAHFQNLGLAYLSPQNKSLAQSFRYMRNKPTIIAFKTPSLENCEKRDSSNSMGECIDDVRFGSLIFKYNYSLHNLLPKGGRRRKNLQ